MQDPFFLNIKKAYPSVKVDYVPRLSTGNKKIYSIRGIDKNRETAFEKLKTIFSNLQVQYEIKESKSVSKNFPYVISVNFNNIQYQYTTKPDITARVSSGSIAQDKFAQFVKLFGAVDIKTAKAGSQETDVSFSINGVSEAAEIKNASSLSKINVFDITVYRAANKSSASKDIVFIDELINGFTNYPSLESYIDYLRQTDTSIGYSGDEGVKNTSGSLPIKHFKFSTNLDKAVSTFKNHWYKNKDNYFVLVNGNKFIIFNANSPGQLSNNIQKLIDKEIPTFSILNLKEISFLTYGSTRPGAIRMQLSASMSSSISIDVNQTMLDKININI
jgi:hypothetical protein